MMEKVTCPCRMTRMALSSEIRELRKERVALANELAATYFLRHGDREWAKTYLERACELYFEWGAVAKCAALESQHKDLLEMEGKRSVRSSTSHGIDLKARARVEDRKIMSRRHQVSKIAFKA